MKAMILAAGRGERMRPLTDSTPKPMLTIGGKPLIQWHIEHLREAGFKELVINVSWRREVLQDYLGDGGQFGIAIDYSVEADGALETAGGIRQALPMLGEQFLVVNGDIWTDYPFASLSNISLSHLAHLVLVPNPAHHPAGDFGLHEHFLLNEADVRYTFSGIGVYRKELFAGLAPGEHKLAPLLRDAVADRQVTGELFPGIWSDVGTPERLAEIDFVQDA